MLDNTRTILEQVAVEILNTLIESWICFPNSMSLDVLELVQASEDQNNAGERFLAEPWPLGDAALALVPLPLRALLGVQAKRAAVARSLDA